MRRLLILIVMLVAAFGATTSAMAAGGPPAGRGGGGGGPGGGGETETLGNNLSVPAVFVPSSTAAGAPALRLPRGSAVAPSGPQSDVFSGYWLQKTEATWSADCSTAAAASVVADWGDNLTASPSIAAGKPVRVEVGLLDPNAKGMTGYLVDNLTPTLADRNATYGTNGTTFTTGNPGAPETRVWDSGAHLTIVPVVDGVAGSPIYDGAMTAEINSTGAVVYGYNWGIGGSQNGPAAGTYRLTFTTSDATTITGVADAAAARVPTFEDHSTILEITVGAGSGSGTGSGRGGGVGNGNGNGRGGGGGSSRGQGSGAHGPSAAAVR